MNIEMVSVIAFAGFMIGFILGRLTAPTGRSESSFIDVAPQPLKPIAGEAKDRIKELVKHDKKIEAIKLYREVSGVGLKEAKDAIDKMTDEL